MNMMDIAHAMYDNLTWNDSSLVKTENMTDLSRDGGLIRWNRKLTFLMISHAITRH